MQILSVWGKITRSLQGRCYWCGLDGIRRSTMPDAGSSKHLSGQDRCAKGYAFPSLAAPGGDVSRSLPLNMPIQSLATLPHPSWVQLSRRLIVLLFPTWFCITTRSWQKLSEFSVRSKGTEAVYLPTQDNSGLDFTSISLSWGLETGVIASCGKAGCRLTMISTEYPCSLWAVGLVHYLFSCTQTSTSGADT